MTTFDLSITKNPEWIKEREELWKPIGESLKEGLRKKDVDKIYHYFMTGTLKDDEEMSDSAKFYWFPVQNPDAWNHIFENMFNSKDAEKEFESIFYFQLGDLSGRALTAAQELAMWDYFVGKEFKSVIVSRVPVGQKGNCISFELDKGEIAARFSLGIKGWLSGGYGHQPKWIKRIDYFTSYLSQISDDQFAKDEDGVYINKTARIIKSIFNVILKKDIPTDDINENNFRIRQEFCADFKSVLDHLNMPLPMKQLWKSIKAEHGE